MSCNVGGKLEEAITNADLDVCFNGRLRLWLQRYNRTVDGVSGGIGLSSFAYQSPKID
ncbi:hypothetical protein [Pandoraea sputorum]|uniref:hypothetical protein n=1 Tax=Pandoraea sputorum TaxID=93222 RepID=UPI00177E7CB2|nr:hypothetical protein [Pandoraea sputorum]